MFAKWQKFDPNGTEFINYNQLSDFVESLEKPLGIPKPNRLKLISMDLTICEKDRVHCVDILDALTKNFLGTSGEIEQDIPMEVIKKDRPSGYTPKSTALKLQRENYCAKIITKAVRKYAAIQKQTKLQRRIVEKVTIDEDISLYENSPVRKFSTCI